MSYRFDEFEIDTDHYVLRRQGTVIHVEPLVFDLICFFSKNSGRVLDRDEIIKHVWQGRIVSDATVSSCIKAARKVLGDSGEQQAYIKTVRGRGFQFAVEVEEVSSEKITVGSNNHVLQQQQADDQPSLVVLPFQVFGDEGDLLSLSDGIVENLTTILTRVPLLSIASRSSSFAMKGLEVSPELVRTRLGVKYMLEGSLQQIGDTIRLNVQLIETRNGFHLWAQVFEEPVSSDVMVKLLSSCISRLEPQLVRAIFNDLRISKVELGSRQLLIQAVSLLSIKGWHGASFNEAAVLLRRSIELEPDLALSHAHLALILGFGQRIGLLEQTDENVQETIDEVDKALELDNMDSIVLGLTGCALADIGLVERAIPLLKQSTELNPNNAQAWAALGAALLVQGDVEIAIKNLEYGITISPVDGRLAMWYAVLALAYLYIRDPDKALDAAQKGCQSDDKNYMPRVALTAVLIKSGQKDKAVQALRDCYRVKPDLSQNEIKFLVGRKLGAAFESLQEISGVG